MSATAPAQTHRHGDRSRPAVLLVNLGTPEAPTPQALRRYLRQFLSDPRVVEIPRMIWVPILHGAILPFRPRESAKRYASVWTEDGSPLRVHTERQATLLRGYLGERLRTPVEVAWAMRYGEPSIDTVVRGLLGRGCDRLAVLPMYPQYSSSTTGSVMDAVGAALAGLRNPPALRVVKHFHDDAGYIGALAQSVRDDWMRTGRPDRLVMSFHGVPRRTLDLGDPYHCECLKTGRLLGEALGLADGAYRITFQSRFGRAEWLKPYTADVLRALGAERLGRVDVICPGFVADCLETLEEIALEGREIFRGAGGGELHYIPCLNERDDWIKALTAIATTELTGWTTVPSDAELAAGRARALALGARD